jgi:hypothetical protein
MASRQGLGQMKNYIIILDREQGTARADAYNISIISRVDDAYNVSINSVDDHG